MINTMDIRFSTTSARLHFACAMARINDFASLMDVEECMHAFFEGDYFMPDDSNDYAWSEGAYEFADVLNNDTAGLFEDVLDLCPKGTQVWQVVKDFLDSLPGEIRAIEDWGDELAADERAEERAPRYW